MKEATVAIEDQRFYQHRGVDFMGIGRAVVQDVLHQGASQGASSGTFEAIRSSRSIAWPTSASTCGASLGIVPV